MIKFFKIKCSKESIDIQLLCFINVIVENIFYSFYNLIKFYYDNYIYNAISKKNYNKIKEENIDSEVLIIELNEDGHSELFASDINYFQILGYKKIDLICSPKILKENPLYLFNNKDFLNIFSINQFYVHKLMEENYFSKYKYIFINSIIYYKVLGLNKKTAINLLDEFNENKTKFNNNFKILGYTHTKPLKCKNDFDPSNIFVLYNYLTKNTFFKSLSPIYFTDKIAKTKEKDKIVFSVFGWVMEECRNYELLFNTFKKLLKNNIDNFEIYVVGIYDKSYYHNNKNKYGKKLYNKYSKYKNIHFTGRASNNEMYDICLKTDYVLFLLDQNSVMHLQYIFNKASGTIGLTLGFNMIPIIEKYFAEFYNFNENNAIIYEGDNLYDAMHKAITMPNKKREELEKSLLSLQKDLINKSTNNLSNALK